jgi:hypothetical protein
MMAWTCDVSIEEKVRQDCYNRGYEAGRKNPVEEIVEYIEKLQKQVKEYQDKIEQGTLIELPCKVGDTLYYVNKYIPTPRIEENKVHTIEIYECMDGLTIRIWTQNGTFYADKMPNVFLTKAEAEQRLKELQE